MNKQYRFYFAFFLALSGSVPSHAYNVEAWLEKYAGSSVISAYNKQTSFPIDQNLVTKMNKAVENSTNYSFFYKSTAGTFKKEKPGVHYPAQTDAIVKGTKCSDLTTEGFDSDAAMLANLITFVDRSRNATHANELIIAVGGIAHMNQLYYNLNVGKQKSHASNDIVYANRAYMANAHKFLGKHIVQVLQQMTQAEIDLSQKSQVTLSAGGIANYASNLGDLLGYHHEDAALEILECAYQTTKATVDSAQLFKAVATKRPKFIAVSDYHEMLTNSDTVTYFPIAKDLKEKKYQKVLLLLEGVSIKKRFTSVAQFKKSFQASLSESQPQLQQLKPYIVNFDAIVKDLIAKYFEHFFEWIKKAESLEKEGISVEISGFSPENNAFDIK